MATMTKKAIESLAEMAQEMVNAAEELGQCYDEYIEAENADEREEVRMQLSDNLINVLEEADKMRAWRDKYDTPDDE